MKKYDLWPKTAFYRGGPFDPPPHVITYAAEPMWNRVNTETSQSPFINQKTLSQCLELKCPKKRDSYHRISTFPSAEV